MSTELASTLESQIGNLLRAQKKTISIAESCTGGLITHRLTNIPGSSEYLVAGVIAYAYEAKVVALGVTWDTLNRFGAVSPETARAMARGAREHFGTTLGMAITGIAGPGGGTPDKPVGLTYISISDERDEIVERFVWKKDRVGNKEESTQAALEMLRKYLETRGGPVTGDSQPRSPVGC